MSYMRLNPAGDTPLGDPHSRPPRHSWERVVHNDFIFGGNDTPPPPDYAPMAAASDKAAELGNQLGNRQMDMAREQYYTNLAVAQPVVQAQLDAMRQTASQGQDYYDYMRANQRPVENELNRQAMNPDLAGEAASRADIYGRYGSMQAEAEQGRRAIQGQYDQNYAEDNTARARMMGLSDQQNARGLGLQSQMRGLSEGQYGSNAAQRQQMLGLSEGQYGSNAAQRQQMLGLSEEQSGMNAQQRQQMLDYSGQNEQANTADRNQMLGIRNQGYGNADVIRQQMAARAQSNDATNASEGALISGGDRGIYDARRADIDFGVDNAAADARLGQTQQAGMMMRQAARLGYSPAKMAAMAAQQSYGNASQTASAMNNARRQGIADSRGQMAQGYGLRNAATDQYMGYAGQNRGDILGDSEGRAGAVGASADQRNASYAQRYGAMGTAYDQGNANYAQRYGDMGRAYDQGNANYAQRYGDMGRAYDQGNANYAQRAGALGAEYAQGNELYGQRQGAMQNDYSLRNQSNAARLQNLNANRQMGLDQGQLGIQGAMNNRNLALQDRSTNWGRQLDVAGLYRNMPGASTAAYGLANNFGNSAVANTAMPGSLLMAGAAQGAGMQQQGAGQQIGGLGQVLSAQNSYNNMLAQQNSGGGMGALLGAGAQLGSSTGFLTAIGAIGSDRRLKQNIKEVGKDGKTGLPLYEFSYIGDSAHRYRGVMSDDVRKVKPEAVIRVSGYDRVNYGMLGIEMVEV